MLSFCPTIIYLQVKTKKSLTTRKATLKLMGMYEIWKQIRLHFRQQSLNGIQQKYRCKTLVEILKIHLQNSKKS